MGCRERWSRPPALPSRRPCAVLPACSSALALPVGSVAGEGPRRRELAQLHADHLFIDRDWDELAAVVNIEGQADERRHDRRAPRPGLERWRAAAGGACSLSLLE